MLDPPPPPPTACTQTSAKVTDVTETIRSSLCAALVCGTIHHGPGPHPPTLSTKGLHTLFCVFPFLCLRPSLCLVHPASPAPSVLFLRVSFTGGELFVFGYSSSSSGRLGMGDSSNRFFPTLLPSPNGQQITSVAMGSNYLAVISGMPHPGRAQRC